MYAHTGSLCPAAALAAGCLFSFTGGASAAMQCGNHDQVAKTLTAKYQETRHVLGVVNSTLVMEIFISPKGTWTVLVTDTHGMACVTAAGDEWQELPRTIAGLDS